ncbi:uncharacterized protein RCC_05021 [Ramularia collo-cygni]|uniref:Uncharacterized protein n=1 Tax=Ramularia collo-cygni TaxID=112498 RepID=A0A2D3UXV4_9PEZI|nr:uncharacterized protein RCC_05021 [Ramularia collo-cygni]CZT19175.1 uncharacterized protein RCC_05021 [Ramularia collo-cygni]
MMQLADPSGVLHESDESSITTSNEAAHKIDDPLPDRCRLLELPRELRDMIYKHTISTVIVVDLAHVDLVLLRDKLRFRHRRYLFRKSYHPLIDPSPIVTARRAACDAEGALPRTCKQISMEWSELRQKPQSIRVEHQVLNERDKDAIVRGLSELSQCVKDHQERQQGKLEMPVDIYLGEIDSQIEAWYRVWRHMFKSFLSRVTDVTASFDFKLSAGTFARFGVELDSPASIVKSMQAGYTRDGRPAILTEKDIRGLKVLAWAIAFSVHSCRDIDCIWDAWKSGSENIKGKYTTTTLPLHLTLAPRRDQSSVPVLRRSRKF